MALGGRKLLLDQLNIMDPTKFTNSIYAVSKTTNSEITPHSYYNYFDRHSNNLTDFNGHNITPIAVNKKLNFEHIEPRLAIKFKGDEYIYKLALSTYGANANVIEYSENLNNNNVEYLNDSFTLIKSKNYTKPNSVYKLRHYSNVFWDKLKEENKDNSKILALINVFENTNKNVALLLDENIELKEKIENLENKFANYANY